MFIHLYGSTIIVYHCIKLSMHFSEDRWIKGWDINVKGKQFHILFYCYFHDNASVHEKWTHEDTKDLSLILRLWICMYCLKLYLLYLIIIVLRATGKINLLLLTVLPFWNKVIRPTYLPGEIIERGVQRVIERWW